MQDFTRFFHVRRTAMRRLAGQHKNASVDSPPAAIPLPAKKPAVQGQRADGGAGYAGAAPTFLLNTVVLRKIARKTAAINAPIP